jgi:hypothetical protein
MATEFERGAEAMRAAVREILAAHQCAFINASMESLEPVARTIFDAQAEYVRETIDLVNEVRVGPE